jgi:two-component system OmpR family response regulator/two-component system response regulator QseB
MRLLVVEDDEGIARGLAANLRRHGWAVDVAPALASAWAALRAEPFDAVLLDLGLPDGDGTALLRRLRARETPHPDPSTPVLIMTARDAVEARIEGLDLGADDYVTKPFDFDEVAARLRALQRRASGRAAPLLTHGDLEIDLAGRTARRAGELVELSAREFSVLVVLVHRLRRKLGDELIRTVRGVGYFIPARLA